MKAQTFKILFRLEAPAGIDSVNLCAVCEMPFVPRRDDFIVVLDHDNFRQVEDVYYSPSGGFEVFLRFAEDEHLDVLLSYGWIEEPPFDPSLSTLQLTLQKTTI